MKTLLLFPAAQSARDYRHDHGTGGWIFAPDEPGAESILFPPDMSPSAILRHPVTHGHSGNLIGNG